MPLEEGRAKLYCDNKVVYENTVYPESVLKEKHHSIAYHMWREVVASGMVRITQEDTRTNITDLFTKPLIVQGERT